MMVAVVEWWISLLSFLSFLIFELSFSLSSIEHLKKQSSAYWPLFTVLLIPTCSPGFIWICKFISDLLRSPRILLSLLMINVTFFSSSIIQKQSAGSYCWSKEGRWRAWTPWAPSPGHIYFSSGTVEASIGVNCRLFPWLTDLYILSTWGYSAKRKMLRTSCLTLVVPNVHLKHVQTPF